MLKNLNFNTRHRKLWIASDTHFNHDKPFIINPRGFTDVNQHDEWLESQWNQRVSPDDDVLFLGDFAIRDGDGAISSRYLRSLNGTIYMLWGNHNSGVKRLYRDAIARRYPEDKELEIYPLSMMDGKVIFCGNYVKGHINGTPYVASHFPFHIWDEVGKGAIALSGHSHGGDQLSNIGAPNSKRLDCGIDNFNGPVRFEEVLAIMEKKSIIRLDHHDSKTT